METIFSYQLLCRNLNIYIYIYDYIYENASYLVLHLGKCMNC